MGNRDLQTRVKISIEHLAKTLDRLLGVKVLLIGAVTKAEEL